MTISPISEMFYLFLETLFTDQDCRCFLFLFRPHATWSRGNLQTLKLCTKRFWPGRTRRSLALSTVSRANSWVTLKWLYQILLVTELLKVPGLGREEQAVSQAQFTSEVFLLALFFFRFRLWFGHTLTAASLWVLSKSEDYTEARKAA